MVRAAKPRARRYKFPATIEVIDVASERKLLGQTKDLSIFGCQITCPDSCPIGTKVRLRIIHRGASFTALAQIAHVRGSVMGLEFLSVTDKDRSVLEKWTAELREAGATFTVRPWTLERT